MDNAAVNAAPDERRQPDEEIGKGKPAEASERSNEKLAG